MTEMTKSPKVLSDFRGLLITICSIYNIEKATVKPAITMDTIDISLIKILSEGPEVSLKGSPTVSPTTVALCATDPCHHNCLPPHISSHYPMCHRHLP